MDNPSVQLNVFVASTDYEVEILIDGKLQWHQARSFAGDRHPSIEKARWLNELVKITEQLRKAEGD